MISNKRDGKVRSGLGPVVVGRARLEPGAGVDGRLVLLLLVDEVLELSPGAVGRGGFILVPLLLGQKKKG